MPQNDFFISVTVVARRLRATQAPPGPIVNLRKQNVITEAAAESLKQRITRGAVIILLALVQHWCIAGGLRPSFAENETARCLLAHIARG